MLVECVGTAVFGARILAEGPVGLLQRIQEEILRGRDPAKALFGRLGRFLGGLMLIMPGIGSDIVGFWFWFAGSRQSQLSDRQSQEQAHVSVADFEQAWQGDEFESRIRRKKTSDDEEIVDATIIEVEESDPRN